MSETHVVQIDLVGHLTEHSLATALGRADEEVRGNDGKLALAVECLKMTGFDAASRTLFVQWNTRNRLALPADAYRAPTAVTSRHCTTEFR